MFTRDVFPSSKNGAKQLWVGKLFVLTIAAAGLVIAYRPPSTLLRIATETFTGLAVLFPTVIGGLYWRSASSLAGILSILAGEGMVAGYMFGVLPTFGFLPVIPVLAVTSLIFIVCSLIQSPLPLRTHFFWLNPRKNKKGWRNGAIPCTVFVILFLLGIDVWAWGSRTPLILGLPWWVWYFCGLNALLIVAMNYFLTEKSP